ncbi:MAG: hemolysin family protein [Eubacteriales bacterium]|nr:hemolysin family protein [Eubacteriales bacterium]
MNDGHPADGNEGLFSGLIRKLAGKGKREEDVTEEIMDMVNESHENGVIAESEAEMIGNIFELGEKKAEDVMTHRKHIIALDSSITVKEAFDIVMEENYSRYPVFDGDLDNIIGVLHIRDLLKLYVEESNRDKKLFQVKNQIMFDPYCIPETRNISLLFKEMQSKKNHMAIVVDEYGQTTGIITMEDILEEIVGNILDEYDDEEEQVKANSDGTYEMNGQTMLEDIEDKLNIKFDCEDIDTINGYIIYKLGKIPEKDEQFETECNGYIFKILSVENKMVAKVLATPIKDKENEEHDENKTN